MDLTRSYDITGSVSYRIYGSYGSKDGCQSGVMSVITGLALTMERRFCWVSLHGIWISFICSCSCCRYMLFITREWAREDVFMDRRAETQRGNVLGFRYDLRDVSELQDLICAAHKLTEIGFFLVYIVGWNDIVVVYWGLLFWSMQEKSLFRRFVLRFPALLRILSGTDYRFWCYELSMVLCWMDYWLGCWTDVAGQNLWKQALYLVSSNQSQRGDASMVKVLWSGSRNQFITMVLTWNFEDICMVTRILRFMVFIDNGNSSGNRGYLDRLCGLGWTERVLLWTLGVVTNEYFCEFGYCIFYTDRVLE